MTLLNILQFAIFKMSHNKTNLLLDFMYHELLKYIDITCHFRVLSIIMSTNLPNYGDQNCLLTQKENEDGTQSSCYLTGRFYQNEFSYSGYINPSQIC